MGRDQQLPSITSRTQGVTKTPPLFKVLMHNDDYTTMEFVVEVLQAVFHQSDAVAERVMLAIHFQGLGHCGTYPFAIAETKVEEVCNRARKAGYPLRCSIEKE
jgi:ATP-dependent Clp protease adaptor protein ClpS